jgi:hypothetical protein
MVGQTATGPVTVEWPLALNNQTFVSEPLKALISRVGSERRS